MTAAAASVNTPTPETPVECGVPSAPLINKPLRRFVVDVERAGLVGEKENAKIIFLAAVSAMLDKPLNVTINGASSAGKNFLMEMATKFLPQEMKKPLSGMSPKSLMYAEEDEYRHKVVLITEYEGVAGADYPIRIMQSEGGIDYEFVDTSSGRPKKQSVKVNGPTGFIQATTRAMLHPENETRLLFIEMDESEDQTRRIIERQASRAEVAANVTADFALWHDFIRSLTVTKVVIPFAQQLTKDFPTDQIRSRRDFPKLLGLIEASAFLHQHEREINEQGCIVASEEDCTLAKSLFKRCAEAGPDKKLALFLGAARKIAAYSEGGLFTVGQIMKETGWGKTYAYQVLERAENKSYVTEEKRGYYRLLG